MRNAPDRGDEVAPRRLPASVRREQLLSVASTIFAQSGFNATTMDDIADAAGVTKPLLYQHFASKRALYQELVDNVAQTVSETIAKAATSAPGPRQQVELGLVAYFHLLVNHAEAFRLVFVSDVPNDPELSRAFRHVENVLLETVDVLIDAGLDEDHRRLLANAVIGMVEGATRHFLESNSDSMPVASEVERVARRLGDLAWAGLRQVHPDAG